MHSPFGSAGARGRGTDPLIKYDTKYREVGRRAGLLNHKYDMKDFRNHHRHATHTKHRENRPKQTQHKHAPKHAQTASTHTENAHRTGREKHKTER